MKLIDLLVQELPKRGGWPEGVDSIHQDYDGEIYAWTGSSAKFLFRTGIIADNCRPYGLDESIENMVTRNQYKSVLALSQKPAWNGEGVPPVGCECESKQFSQVDWAKFKVVAVCDGHVFGFWGNGVSTALDSKMWEFRPLRTEAERKRDSAVEAVLKTLNYYDFEMVHIRGDQNQVATEIIDAIAAGKIPGVKLED